MWNASNSTLWWLGRSLNHLKETLRHLGADLLVRKGTTPDVLVAVARETHASAVYWNRPRTPRGQTTAARVIAALKQVGVSSHECEGDLLFDPTRVARADGTPRKIFTPFLQACLREPSPRTPIEAPRSITRPTTWPSQEPTQEISLDDPHPSLAAIWSPGETPALAHLATFVETGLNRYAKDRDELGFEGTSRLSPHLRFGELSPRHVWHVTNELVDDNTDLIPGITAFQRQLIWREFATHVLLNQPAIEIHPMRAEYEHFPWHENKTALEAWQHGQTGYPLVDAGMRHLAAEGWLPNRARMVVASFLVKHLLLPWQAGARWFWSSLVDADPANNTLGWQWVTGSGWDAAPYFRIFNPTRQSRRFDPEGIYTRQWIPELRALPSHVLHEPSTAPATTLINSGVTLGSTYPFPIVDHAKARGRALQAFAQMRKTQSI